jgi:Zn-dependent protease
MDISPQLVISVILQFAIVLFSLSVHESAHAWMADRLGDSTGRMLGRITLNPWPHIDVIGTILMPIILSISGLPVFGWAKPVPVISRNFKRLRRDMALVGAAGPISNLILAIAVTGALCICLFFMGPAAFAKEFTWNNVVRLHPESALDWLGVLGSINLLLGTFNLIPLPPLDGSWILSALLPPFAQPMFEGLRRMGPIILIFLFVSGLINVIIGPVYVILSAIVMGLPLSHLARLLGS